MKTSQPFETVMAEIDELVQKLEDPQTGLEASLKLFEKGSQRIVEARKRLEVIEHEFEIIQKRLGETAADTEETVDTSDSPQESLGL